jgi:hypothetical protein
VPAAPETYQHPWRACQANQRMLLYRRGRHISHLTAWQTDRQRGILSDGVADTPGDVADSPGDRQAGIGLPLSALQADAEKDEWFEEKKEWSKDKE